MTISRWIRAGMGVELKGLMPPDKVDKTMSQVLEGVTVERYY